MEDWDLQAIVKGCSRQSSTVTKLMEEDPNLFSFLSEEDGFSCVYPQLFDNTAATCSSSSNNSHEFEGFGSLISPNNYYSASISDVFGEFKEHRDDQKLLQKKQTAAPKHKPSKKSRQNRIVKEVKAESVCSDSWGWRKYGQKPIKGSPYPRSYYRCSSSKGCSARKQVERSLTDPDVFLVTYTAEHNHAEPTRRNALAGTTRKKFPVPPENSTFDMVLSPNNSTSVASNVEEEQPIMELGVAEGGVLMNVKPFEFSSEDLFNGLEDLLFG